MPVRGKPQLPTGIFASSTLCRFARQHGDVAGHLAHAEILHQHLAQLAQRVHLVGAIHRRAGIDHIAQRRMIVAVDRIVPRQHGQDGRHGEHVGDAMPLDQAPGLLAVQPLARQQHGRRAARHLRQSMHAGAMRQRRHHQRDVMLGRRRHQVAQMVADDVFHLAVRQHARLRPPGGAGGIEEPRRMIMRHVGSARRARRPCAASASHSSAPGPMEISSRHAGFSAFAAAAWSGNAASKICTAAPDDVARYATSGGVSRKFVGTHTAPSIHDANIVSSTALELRACSSTRSPCRTPRAASAPAAAWTRAENSAQVQVRSRQMIAGRSGKRRAVCSSRCARLLVGISAAAPGSTRSSPPPRRPC